MTTRVVNFWFMTAVSGTFMSVSLMYKRKNKNQRSNGAMCNKFYTVNGVVLQLF